MPKKYKERERERERKKDREIVWEGEVNIDSLWLSRCGYVPNDFKRIHLYLYYAVQYHTVRLYVQKWI